MSENKASSIPKGSLEVLIEFFDTQDMGDHWDELADAHFDVDLGKRAHAEAG